MADHLIWSADRNTTPAGAPVRLNVLACAECGRCSFPATGTCTWCGGAGEERAAASDGTLVAATAVLHGTPGCALETPYLVAMVRFDDVRLDVLGRVLGAPDVDALAPGTHMTVVAQEFDADRLHYAFAAALPTVSDPSP